MIKTIKYILHSPLSFFTKLVRGYPKLRLEADKEYTNRVLFLSGNLPSWLSGSLVKNCTVAIYEEGKEKTAHMFDGVAMLHSFHIEEGKVSYSSRYLQSEGYAKVIQSNTEFYAGKNLEKTKNIQDAAVNVFKYNKDYVALTETPLPVRFDLKSLETLGNFEFQDELPKKDTFESAHPHYFEDSREIFNFLIEYGRTTHYVVYKMAENSHTREVIARIPVKNPSYMHSFAMTENYIVLVEYPLVVNPLRLLLATIDSFSSYIANFKWLPEQGTRFLVVDKKSAKLVSEIKTQAFFSFHHANAYECGEEIVIDLTANNYARQGHVLPHAEGSQETIQGLQRFRINLGEQKIHHENVLEKFLEFPKIPDHLNGKRYRYLYMVNLDLKDSSLVKYDWERREEISWKAPNAKIIEPIFVPAPHAKSEDDGVLLTVVCEESANLSYLLVLDAQSLQEMARAFLPEPLATSFHGQFFTAGEIGKKS